MSSVDEQLNEAREKVEAEYSEKIKETWHVWKEEFIKKFPFREKPELIDNLTPEDVYNPGISGYFLDYIEHKLKNFGHIHVPSDKPWKSAKDNLDLFKKLLKIAVNDKISLAKKIDAEWDKLPGWGGDRHYAKKIVFCYYPENVIPIFKTEHLEHFLEKLGLLDDAYKKAQVKYQMNYEDLTVGQKYELLNSLLIEFKEKSAVVKDEDNVFFGWVLYTAFPPLEPISPEKVAEPMSATRMLFSPVNELGVVTLFAMYHRELGFPYILKVKSDYPDAVVVDKYGEVKTVEFELFASNFIAHKHDPDKCDYIICWENDLAESEDKEAKALTKKIIALKDKFGEIEE